MNKENKLATLNGQQQNLRKQKIIKGVRTQYPNLEDEVAILRKTVYILAQKVKEQHPDIDLTELLEYHTFVEEVKTEVTTETSSKL